MLSDHPFTHSSIPNDILNEKKLNSNRHSTPKFTEEDDPTDFISKTDSNEIMHNVEPLIEEKL